MTTTHQESLRDFAIFQAQWLLRRAEAMVEADLNAPQAISDAFRAVAHLVELRAQEETP